MIESVDCEMAAILSRPQCVNSLRLGGTHLGRRTLPSLVQAHLSVDLSPIKTKPLLNQCWLMFNWTLRDKQNLLQNIKVFEKNTSGIVVWKTSTVLFMPHCFHWYNPWILSTQKLCISGSALTHLPGLFLPSDHVLDYRQVSNIRRTLIGN